jgi:hypothetical protein
LILNNADVKRPCPGLGLPNFIRAPNIIIDSFSPPITKQKLKKKKKKNKSFSNVQIKLPGLLIAIPKAGFHVEKSQF